jgi:hypothetical protein
MTQTERCPLHPSNYQVKSFDLRFWIRTYPVEETFTWLFWNLAMFTFFLHLQSVGQTHIHTQSSHLSGFLSSSLRETHMSFIHLRDCAVYSVIIESFVPHVFVSGVYFYVLRGGKGGVPVVFWAWWMISLFIVFQTNEQLSE